MREAQVAVVMGRTLRQAVGACQRHPVTDFRLNRDMTMGDRVRELRKGLNITHAELAKRVGVAPGTIGDIEQGTQRRSSYIDLLAKALNTTAAYLRDGKGSSPDASTFGEIDDRERSLIDKFRLLSLRDRQRVEDFIAGMKPSRRGPKRPTIDPEPSRQPTSHPSHQRKAS